MAPRFKQKMYQTYAKDKGADALICFPFADDKLIFPFRDEIVKQILNKNTLFLNKNDGEPTPHDSWYRFSKPEDKSEVNNFFSKEYPPFFSCIFKTKKWKEYDNEMKRINKLVQFELSTSHDHPCIEVYSQIHSENSLSELIENVAKILKIDMKKNDNLPSMSDTIMTNKTFDIN